MSSDVWNRDSSTTRQFTNMHFEDRTPTELVILYCIYMECPKFNHKFVI